MRVGDAKLRLPLEQILEWQHPPVFGSTARRRPEPACQSWVYNNNKIHIMYENSWERDQNWSSLNLWVEMHYFIVDTRIS